MITAFEYIVSFGFYIHSSTDSEINQTESFMLLPELSRENTHGLGPSKYFFKGLYKRLTKRRREKIFVLGFHKTGTTSLARALQVLGYRVCGFVNPKGGVKPSKNTRQELFDLTYKPLLDKYDAFEDILWCMFYRELSEMYPDAKFVLTVRPEESWYKSMVKHFGGYDRESFHWLYDGYGDPVGHKELYQKKYAQHNAEVIEYFKNRDNDFLIMYLPRDFNWDVLCEFMECRKPSGSFPHANPASIRGTWKRKIIDEVKAWYYKYNKVRT